MRRRKRAGRLAGASLAEFSDQVLEWSDRRCRVSRVSSWALYDWRPAIVGLPLIVSAALLLHLRGVLTSWAQIGWVALIALLCLPIVFGVLAHMDRVIARAAKPGPGPTYRLVGSLYTRSCSILCGRQPFTPVRGHVSMSPGGVELAWTPNALTARSVWVSWSDIEEATMTITASGRCAGFARRLTDSRQNEEFRLTSVRRIETLQFGGQ